jgi:hypothetical protein
MPIVRISKTVVKQCCSRCGAMHAHDISKLCLGVPRASPDYVQLPACRCGAVEILVCNPLAQPSNERSHRKAVNALAALLRQLGQVSEAFDYSDAVEARDTMALGAEVAVERTLEQP